MLARIKRNSTTGNLEIQRLSGMSPDSVPIGVIFPLYSNTVPTGFLPCNGAQFDAEQYTNLYNLLGTNVLPDLRECALVGIGENSTDTFTTHDIYTLGQFKDCQSTPNSAGPTVTGNNLVLNNDTTLGASNRYVVHQYTSNPVDPVTGVTRARSKGVNFIIKAVTGNVTSDIENALNAKVDKTLTTPITIDETTYNTVIAALEAMAAKINSGLEAIQYVTTLPVSPDIHNVIYAIMGTSKYKYYAGDEDNQTLQELGGSGSTFIGTQAQWDALTSAEQLEYDVADITDAPGDGTVVVDAVEDGNLNAVSSNAVSRDLILNINVASESSILDYDKMYSGNNDTVVSSFVSELKQKADTNDQKISASGTMYLANYDSNTYIRSGIYSYIVSLVKGQIGYFARMSLIPADSSLEIVAYTVSLTQDGQFTIGGGIKWINGTWGAHSGQSGTAINIGTIMNGYFTFLTGLRIIPTDTVANAWNEVLRVPGQLVHNCTLIGICGHSSIYYMDVRASNNDDGTWSVYYWGQGSTTSAYFDLPSQAIPVLH